MRSLQPRTRPLALSASGVRVHRFGALAVPPSPVNAGRNALAMRGSRPLASQIGRETACSYIAAQSLGCQARPPRRLERWHRVINVLCHDLPRPARRVNMASVERDAGHLRCLGRVGGAVGANAGSQAAASTLAPFIDGDQTGTEVRRGLEYRPLQQAALRPEEPRNVWRMARFSVRSSGCNGSLLHPSAKCNSVLDNVYSGPDTTCTKGSGGVGKRHAGDGSRH